MVSLSSEGVVTKLNFSVVMVSLIFLKRVVLLQRVAGVGKSKLTK